MGFSRVAFNFWLQAILAGSHNPAAIRPNRPDLAGRAKNPGESIKIYGNFTNSTNLWFKAGDLLLRTIISILLVILCSIHPPIIKTGNSFLRIIISNLLVVLCSFIGGSDLTKFNGKNIFPMSNEILGAQSICFQFWLEVILAEILYNLLVIRIRIGRNFLDFLSLGTFLAVTYYLLLHFKRVHTLSLESNFLDAQSICFRFLLEAALAETRYNPIVLRIGRNFLNFLSLGTFLAIMYYLLPFKRGQKSSLSWVRIEGRCVDFLSLGKFLLRKGSLKPIRNPLNKVNLCTGWACLNFLSLGIALLVLMDENFSSSDLSQWTNFGCFLRTFISIMLVTLCRPPPLPLG